MTEQKAKLNYQRKCYTIADYYLSYKDYIEANTPYDVPIKVFKQIVTEYFKYLRDEVMLNSKEIKIPCRLGTLQIIKHKPKEYSGKSLRIDYKSTKELNKLVYFLNDHSNNYKYRYHWSKTACITPNKTKYQFVATRENKRNLAKLIFSQEKDYLEL